MQIEEIVFEWFPVERFLFAVPNLRSIFDDRQNESVDGSWNSYPNLFIHANVDCTFARTIRIVKIDCYFFVQNYTKIFDLRYSRNLLVVNFVVVFYTFSKVTECDHFHLRIIQIQLIIAVELYCSIRSVI